MHDHSHKLLFLGASALMCAAGLYASQAGPWLAIDDSLAPAASFSPIHRTQFASDASARGVSDARQVFLPVANVETHANTATIMPNGTSCPAANAARLVTPDGALPAGAPPPRPPLQTDAALGTGSSCPPARADARTAPDSIAGSTGMSPATPKPLAAAGLPPQTSPP